MERLLTVEDVMEIVQVSRRTAYTYMQTMIHMTRPLRVTEAALKAWIAERMTAPGQPVAKAKKPQAYRHAPVTHIERRKGGGQSA